MEGDTIDQEDGEQSMQSKRSVLVQEEVERQISDVEERLMKRFAGNDDIGQEDWKGFKYILDVEVKLND